MADNLTTPVIEKENIFPVAALAASAGGLDAFRQLIGSVPQNSGIAFMLMQHLDPAYETSLAEILQRSTALPVLNLPADAVILPDHIYVVPAGKLLTVKEGQLHLETRPEHVHPLHSIDIFFTAIGEVFQSKAFGVVLSGMGGDGTSGLKKIKDNGGVTIAQAPATAQFPGMPQHAIDAGVVDFQTSPADIPELIRNLFTQLHHGPAQSGITRAAEDELYYKQVLNFLRLRREVDFTYYKQSTIRRRILRRMVINRIDNLRLYTTFLEENAGELDVLYDDLLIPVTSFFRDPVIFNNLCNRIFPVLFKNRNPSLPIRIWVTGCSTGEEAYSMAICLHEYLGDAIAGLKVQLFATDLSEKAIRKARGGVYSRREIEGVGPDRLQMYFVKTDGHYHLRKNIRDLCVFATHNFLKDPPFARMDLISCRNVLIYMDGYLQKKAMSTFHYALNENGFLLLGKSETAGNASELFKIFSKQDKMYTRKPVQGRTVRLLPERAEKSQAMRHEEASLQKGRKEDFEKSADDILLSRYTPVGVVVNEHFEIVQFRGATGKFLEAAPGKASLNILKMAKEGLSFEIRTALHKARERRETIVKESVPLSRDNILVTIEVTPMLQTIEQYFLIIFREEIPAVADIISVRPVSDQDTTAQDALRIKNLEKELAQLREDIRTVTEDQEAANEELQSANEELLSGSEELQSLNEELETSKEELQSTNEELMTVNQELYDRNEQYNLSRLYAEAIVNTIREPLLVLNRDLRIKSANPAFYEYFNIGEDDVNGRILFELQNSRWDIQELRSQLLKIQTGQIEQLELELDMTLSAPNERNIILKVQPVNPQTGDQMILLAFEDITFRKKEEDRLRASARALQQELQIIEHFFSQAPAVFCITTGPEHTFKFVNPAYLEITGGMSLQGRTFEEAFTGSDNDLYKSLLDEVYRTGVPFSGSEMRTLQYGKKETAGYLYADVSIQAYRNSENVIEGLLFFSYDVTEQVLSRKKTEENAHQLENIVQQRTHELTEANTALEHLNRNLQAFASIASHDLQEPLRKMRTFTHMLLTKYREQLPEEAGLLLNKTDHAAARMAALIRDVLNYSRLAKGNGNFVQTDLHQILVNVMDDFDLLISEKNAVINIEDKLPVIQAEPSRMNQLFYNLVGNALKFTSRTQIPIINITCKMLEAEERAAYPSLHNSPAYRIIFSDNGIGFNQEFADQIFAVFERLNNISEYEGTGIGLALCKRITEQHHGLIFATSEENTGSTFTIILPETQPGTEIRAALLNESP